MKIKTKLLWLVYAALLSCIACEQNWPVDFLQGFKGKNGWDYIDSLLEPLYWFWFRNQETFKNTLIPLFNPNGRMVDFVKMCEERLAAGDDRDLINAARDTFANKFVPIYYNRGSWADGNKKFAAQDGSGGRAFDVFAYLLELEPEEIKKKFCFEQENRIRPTCENDSDAILRFTFQINKRKILGLIGKYSAGGEKYHRIANILVRREHVSAEIYVDKEFGYGKYDDTGSIILKMTRSKYSEAHPIQKVYFLYEKVSDDFDPGKENKDENMVSENFDLILTVVMLALAFIVLVCVFVLIHFIERNQRKIEKPESLKEITNQIDNDLIKK